MDRFNQVYNEDFLSGVGRIPDASVDLIVADPPYNLGKDYGNDSDQRESAEFLEWTRGWLELAIPKLKEQGSLYIFATWRYSPEIFSFLKTRMLMINEIIWDRKVPSMGGSTRRYSSVHDTIGFFARSKDYYFDLDAVRIPYDAATKKARSRSHLCREKMARGRLQSERRLVGFAPAPHPQRTRKSPDPKTARDNRAHDPRSACPANGVVFDPFAGSGTTVAACLLNERKYVAYEINEDYYRTILSRIKKIKDDNAEIVSVAQASARALLISEIF